jgi:nucleoside diphosphate kinase
MFMSYPNWDNAFVLVITPDAFVRGLGSRILAEFTGHGFRPGAARVVRPGSRELDALYEDVVASNGNWGTYRYRCVDSLFGLGPSLSVVMEAPADASGALHERVQRLKGSGPLAQADPNSLRRRYRSINSILSLIHTSATPAEAELDFAIFFRRDWLTRWDAVSAHESTVTDPIDARFAAEQLDRGASNRETRGFPEVRRQLRARLVAQLWEHLADPLQKAVLKAYELDGPAYVEDAQLLGSLGAHLQERVDPQLVLALSSQFTPARPPVDAKRLWSALTGFGVTVDPWERAVLSTSQHFEPAVEG